jgi:DNA-binding CsgD family transcriptional regulator
MILVFDRDGSIFPTLRALDLGLPLWRVQDPSRLEKVDRVELAIVSTFGDVPWKLIADAERPFDTIVLTRRYDEAEALDALGRGLVGYIDVTAGEKHVRDSIRACLDGEPAYDPHIVGRWLRRQNSCARSHCNVGRLTERQREVLRLVADGLADKEIAERLGIATATAQKHVTNILERLHVANRAAAAASVCSLIVTEPIHALQWMRPVTLAPAV